MNVLFPLIYHFRGYFVASGELYLRTPACVPLEVEKVKRRFKIFPFTKQRASEIANSWISPRNTSQANHKMTARSKKQRMKNARIKRARNAVKELKTLKRTVLGKDAAELMDLCSEVVDPKTVEELKQVTID
jgi:Learning-associated protein